MTRYEQGVQDGSIVPMNGFDWLLLQNTVEGFLNGDTDPEIPKILSDMMVEIEHLYDDDEETLKKIKQKL